MRDTLISQLTALAKKDPSIVLITGDLGFGVLNDYANDLPGQFLNAGVAEQNMTGIATGLALEGKKVFTYSIGNFNTLRCLEQIRNDACYHDANVNIISIGGGFSYGQLGFSHHATEDYGILNTLPGISIFTPGSKKETVSCLESALKIDNVCYLRIDKSDFEDNYNDIDDISLPREIIEGSDFLVVGVGGVIEEAIFARKEIKERFSIEIGVVSIPQLKPLDSTSLEKIISKYGTIITIEEHNLVNGLSSMMKQLCFDASLGDKKIYSLGINDSISSVVGDQKYLRNKFGISSKEIIEIVRDANEKNY